jgi:hypothetical protein
MEQRLAVSAAEAADDQGDADTERGAQSGLSLFFSTQGYGTIVIAVFVAGVAAALASMKIIGGQAIAGLLGALLGYIFTSSRGSGENRNGSRGDRKGGRPDEQPDDHRRKRNGSSPDAGNRSAARRAANAEAHRRGRARTEDQAAERERVEREQAEAQLVEQPQAPEPGERNA